MKAEDCPRIDDCLTIKSLFSRDWVSDAQLAAAIREFCERCPGPHQDSSSNGGSAATAGTESQ